MKDLGKLSWFLGTEFKCKESCIEMNQKQYIEKVLLKFGMADCKPKPTPCVLGIEKVSDEESPSLEDPVTKLSQKISKPTRANLDLAKHVLRYLRGTSEQGLTFRKSNVPLRLNGFCDSDWGASVADRRSITGYNFQLSSTGPLISWKSRKQPTVALSTCEAEYIALANAVQEAKFLRQLCIDMKVSISDDNVLIQVDNQGAINLARNPVHHQRSKHIDIKYHFIRSEIQVGTISLKYVPTEDNIADVFTKPASKANHKLTHVGQNQVKVVYVKKIVVFYRKIDTTNEPFECDVCKMRFTKSSDLEIHKRTHIEDTNFDSDVSSTRILHSNSSAGPAGTKDNAQSFMNVISARNDTCSHCVILAKEKLVGI
ncbi:Poly (gag pol) of Ty Copia retrotransposon [Paramuricea clavata]|uniref:Poly (Gag pol) of Ty Copia retrotransposon n=1 Tax=Paramuricea clavata TaxID=317549 RepID=A0A7D9EJG3_PARCT|nr:Poly (gag pol) of Ty Copia retrotransposon [Paramuricea clavata]